LPGPVPKCILGVRLLNAGNGATPTNPRDQEPPPEWEGTIGRSRFRKNLSTFVEMNGIEPSAS
jgi:hypothetical protein